MPWSEFGNFWGITPWRLVVLGILVILLRRLPWVLLLVSRSTSQSLNFAVALYPRSPDVEGRRVCRILWSYR